MLAPTSTALITADGEYTFAELADAARGLSPRLPAGACVVIRLGNDAASVVAVHAAWAAGCSVALNDLPAVADSAVAGVPEERLGEVPVAAVITRPGADTDTNQIRDELRTRLAAYELPRSIVVVDEIPRFDTGKVDRATVAALFIGAPM